MLLGVERKHSFGNWLVYNGKKLNEFSTREVELSKILRVRPKTLRVLNWISIGEMALSVPSSLIGEQTVVDGIRNLSPTVSSFILDNSSSIILAGYTGALIGVSHFLVLRACSAKNIQRSTVLPFVARVIQAVGNHLAA